MSPDTIRERGLWPKGFLPLPHPFHPTGGFVFPKEEIDAIKQQDGRDLRANLAVPFTWDRFRWLKTGGQNSGTFCDAANRLTEGEDISLSIPRRNLLKSS
jgi:hypothetical protein